MLRGARAAVGGLCPVVLLPSYGRLSLGCELGVTDGLSIGSVRLTIFSCLIVLGSNAILGVIYSCITRKSWREDLGKEKSSIRFGRCINISITMFFVYKVFNKPSRRYTEQYAREIHQVIGGAIASPWHV
jgi:hypothetical protein